MKLGSALAAAAGPKRLCTYIFGRSHHPNLSTYYPGPPWQALLALLGCPQHRTRDPRQQSSFPRRSRYAYANIARVPRHVTAMPILLSFQWSITAAAAVSFRHPIGSWHQLLILPFAPHRNTIALKPHPTRPTATGECRILSHVRKLSIQLPTRVLQWPPLIGH